MALIKNVNNVTEAWRLNTQQFQQTIFKMDAPPADGAEFHVLI